VTPLLIFINYRKSQLLLKYFNGRKPRFLAKNAGLPWRGSSAPGSRSSAGCGSHPLLSAARPLKAAADPPKATDQPRRERLIRSRARVIRSRMRVIAERRIFAIFGPATGSTGQKNYCKLVPLPK
jgi:hypothetical protein